MKLKKITIYTIIIFFIILSFIIANRLYNHINNKKYEKQGDILYNILINVGTSQNNIDELEIISLEKNIYGVVSSFKLADIHYKNNELDKVKTIYSNLIRQNHVPQEFQDLALLYLINLKNPNIIQKNKSYPNTDNLLRILYLLDKNNKKEAAKILEQIIIELKSTNDDYDTSTMLPVVYQQLIVVYNLDKYFLQSDIL